MTIHQITEAECRLVLSRGSTGRLGCALNDQPYIVPVSFAYESDSIYVFATFGQKIEWMRMNPQTCMQVDEIENVTQWVSVIANGKYEELPEDDRPHARNLLEQRHTWWLNALAERRSRVEDLLVDPLFFRIRIESLSGLRATDSLQTGS